MSENEIWIIGTEPPCPRCDYLNRMVVDIVNDLELPVRIRHVDYTSADARRVARSAGLEPGTAKEVAKRLTIDIDWPAIYSMIEPDGDEPADHKTAACCATAANRWSPELDAALRPCETRALEAGIMMTPVLVIDGKPIHQGSVPDIFQTRKWLRQAYSRKITASVPESVIEVLGPGCAKCNTLYENVRTAVAANAKWESVSIKKRTDIAYFQKMGVAVTPGLIVNGRVVSKGKVATVDEIAAYIDAANVD